MKSIMNDSEPHLKIWIFYRWSTDANTHSSEQPLQEMLNANKEEPST